jgi:pimeloyl-ACP methyl ester carboxylesterase
MSTTALTRVLIAGALLLLAAIGGCTDPIDQSQTDNIYVQEKLPLGGLPQTVLISGKDSSAPILLILHGGPGFSEMALISSYNRKLEEHFVVVNWDQRGTNLSYSPNLSAKDMTIEQFVSDAHELVGYLQQRFRKQKIYLLGHSWGSYLGIELARRYPQDFHAYISVAQMANMIENERLSFQFTLEQARKDSNQEAIQQLEAIAPKYEGPNGPDLMDLQVQRRWLLYYGGAVYGQQDYSSIFQGILPEKRHLLNDTLAAQGEVFSISTLWHQLLTIDVFTTAPKLQVPVHFFVGRHDYNTPFVLAERYYNTLQAPKKTITWFDHSAHMIPFEEPEKFNNTVIYKVLKGRD